MRLTSCLPPLPLTLNSMFFRLLNSYTIWTAQQSIMAHLNTIRDFFAAGGPRTAQEWIRLQIFPRYVYDS
jgi:hypothetical protein